VKELDLENEIKMGHIILKNFLLLSEEEKELVLAWRNFEGIKKWMYTDYIITKKEHNVFLKHLKKNSQTYFFLVKDQDDNYLGVISFKRVNFRNRNAYFGIYSNPDSKVTGLGRLLDNIAKDFAFKILHLHTLKLEVIESNVQVINLHKKMGFEIEGRLKEYVCKNSEWKDVVIMGLVNENYE
jgi:UDP-4-amino-4,6-dideoxy-N-acetyl-beta-L-altrosamine N-acetyltransferase